MSTENDPPTSPGSGVRLALVVKRDGREVPFDGRKIRDAVARAQAAVGDDDPQFAEEVASVVALTLEQKHRPEGGRGRVADAGPIEARPTIEEIQDLVEEALIGMGRARVAKAYILYRARRGQVRDALRVQGDDGGALASRVHVQQGERSAPWSKGRIVAALLAEADLPRTTAEEVAARVEVRVFDSGLKRISTGLIRELVDNELVTMGLTAALQRQKSVGVPRHDLRRLLDRQPLTPWGAERGGARATVVDSAAGELLRRFSLEEVFSEVTAERHLAGELSIEDLERPHLYLTLALPADLYLTGEPSPTAAFELLESLVRAAHNTARGVVLEDPGHALQPLVRATRAGSPMGLSAWVRAAAAAARGAGRSIDLGSPGARYTSFTARLVEALAGVAPGSAAPRLFLEEGELDALLSSHPGLGDTVEELAGAGRLLLTWGREDARFVAPGCHRRLRERAAIACGGAVALNLPRAARQAGPWREDLFLGALAGLVQCAVQAFRELGEFQQSYPDARPGVPSCRVGYALVPVGLREALRHLGGGELDPGLGARVLGFLSEASRRFSAEDGPALVLDPFFGERGAARLAHLDAERARSEAGLQSSLFSEAVRPPERAYSSGYGVAPVPGRTAGEAEAELLTTVPCGALHPLAPVGAPYDAPRRESWLPAFARFSSLRPRGFDVERDLLFPASRGAHAKGPRGVLRSSAVPLDPSAHAGGPTPRPARTPRPLPPLEPSPVADPAEPDDGGPR